MGRIFEFAFVTLFITIVHLSFAYFVGWAVSNKIIDLFGSVNEVLSGL